MSPRAAVYVRVSGKKQEARGYSLDGQYTEIREYCAAHGYSVVRKYRDVETGTRTDRRAFHKLLDDAERGRYDIIVVWKRDRFGRTPEENGLIERHLRVLGIRLESVLLGPQPDTALTRLHKRIDDAFSAYEPESMVERIAMAKRQAARKGRWPHRPPYGLRRAGDGSRRLVPDPEASRRVLEAFKRSGDGESTRAVARGLGVSHTAIMGWLRNEAYLGVLRWMEIRVENAWPAIVDRSTWDAAQAALEAARTYYRRAPSRRYVAAVTTTAPPPTVNTPAAHGAPG